MGDRETFAEGTGNLSRIISRNMEDTFGSSRKWNRANDDEVALRLAVLEKLPTHKRVRRAIVTSVTYGNDDKDNGKVEHKEIDVRKLNRTDRKEFIDRLFKIPKDDNDKFLRNFRRRIDKVGIELPTVEVRFENLTVDAHCFIGDRTLPTLSNAALNVAEAALSWFGFKSGKKAKLTILKDATGIIKPARMALLLGPPSSGKTTFLLALAGKLDSNLKVEGEITYNGHTLEEFVAQKTSAYISQNDVHVGQMTVKETLDFSARCQGVGSRYELLTELLRKEKEAGICPDAELDLFMKQTAIQGIQSSLITDYTLRLLGLDICEDTIIGDEMLRGISGGQKKRVTTGEMIVGPTKTLFMDEISTGLDSSTTFQIVKCLQQIVHLTEATVLMSLLQPDPETFNLFDDIILISEGQIVYQGPRDHIVEFFHKCGFKCPERKGVADFLQEVTSMKDQEQYWEDKTQPYKYISVSEFASQFKRFHVGLRLENDLSIPYDKSTSHGAALVFNKYLDSKVEILKATYDKEWLLIRRNSFFYVFKMVQIIIMAVITATVFLSKKMKADNEADGAVYIGSISFAVLINIFNGFAELSLTIQRLPVFYKQRDLLFHPPWAFTLPIFLLSLPISVLESTAYTGVTYYAIGYAPEASRFFTQLLLIFLIQQMANSLFRLICGVCRTKFVSNTGGGLTLLVLILFGFILPKDDVPSWLEWAYWISPIPYTTSSLAVNEMLAPRWMNKLASDNNTSLGVAVLKSFNFSIDPNWVWICAAALFGFIILFNILFTFALTYLSSPETRQATTSRETENAITKSPGSRSARIESDSLRGFEFTSDGGTPKEMANQQKSNQSNYNKPDMTDYASLATAAAGIGPKRGMVLPFTPLAMSFDAVNYFVDVPPMKEQVDHDKLQLLSQVTGAFKPGILTALMGVSGAGKTTLMDVLSGRKTGGHIEGDIRISGYPKKQETFARVTGYCEQNDIHSPQVTVRESLIYSAFLRLSRDIHTEDKMTFVDEVISLVELDNLKDSIVGLPGVSGLSTEQRKRLTIAVELVANPSIIFMDEPTSGLDARAAAIVMRTVRNTVDTGRTVVCTIHQPSIDIFEAFDELLLLKCGGQVIYSGPLGRNSHILVEYFEEIDGVPKIKEKYNPATWMLEVSSVSAEFRLGMDFAEHYQSSKLYQRNKVLVKELSTPSPGQEDLYFPTKYSRSTWEQFTSCLWKQRLSYWRTPDYNLVRFFFTGTVAIILGAVFWKIGAQRERSNELYTIIGAMVNSVMFIGINNCMTVQPLIDVERTVFYRERSAGMYSALPYAMAQVFVEIPYTLFQTIVYSIIAYSMLGFEWTASKFLLFIFIHFFTFLYFTYYGMMTVSLTPNHQIAAILSGAFVGLFNLFSGFYIPKPRIPVYWMWYYYICPMAWTVYGLIVSQFGDVEDTIEVPGVTPDPSIKAYMEVQFGYDPDFMVPVGTIIVGFTVFFAFMYALCLRTLNFQTR
ncbi:ABC transporter G family member 29-like isoform X2 [Daucus carota subsp. sativus]|uniref:ABC transporter G family member 29-like isoform X2 n=1 Tax=Daucus carota subsp. sativus TaxID=79200 RepID=UPI0030839005